MKRTCILSIISFLALFGCNSGSAPSGSNNSSADSGKQIKAATIPPQSKLSPAGTQLLMAVITKYYGLKNALVATKPTSADSASAQLTVVADSLESFLQNDSANKTALKPFIDTIILQSKQVSAIKDETCEKQRLAFGTLSSAMFGLLKNVDMKHAGVYREYCPMAFNEKGAYWLSDESEIKNPYFGKKMIECGEVTDSL